MITLEEIKEMNISVGTPIEVTLKDKIYGTLYKELGYYEGVLSGAESGVLEYSPTQDKVPDERGIIPGSCYINRIQELKILEYKK